MSEHELWNELGKIYFNTGSYDAAINAYTKAIELNPEFGLPYSNLALTYVQKGKYPEALSFYRKSIGLLQNNKAKAIAWNRLGDMYRQLKDYDNAVAAFRKADELDLDLIMCDDTHELIERGLDTDSDPVMRNNTGIVNQKNSEPTDKEFRSGLPSSYQLPLEESSFSIEAEESLHLNKGDPQISIRETAEGDIGVDARIEDIYLEPALFTVNAEEQWQLLENAENLVEIEEPSLESAFVGAESQEFSEMTETEDQELPAALIPNLLDTRPLTPTDLPVYSDPEEELRKVGILPKDIPTPEPASLGDIGNNNLPDTNSGQGGITEEISADRSTIGQDEHTELERDIANMKRVLEINPKNAFGWDSLGKLYKSAGQYDDAIAAYERALELDPLKGFYYYNLGLVYAAKKEFDKAIQIFQNVLELNPDYNLAHATIAGCYRRLGNEEEAQKHIKIASISMQDENEYNLACFEAICGNVDQSIELLRASLARNQVSMEWVRRDPDLDFVREDPRYEELVGIR